MGVGQVALQYAAGIRIDPAWDHTLILHKQHAHTTTNYRHRNLVEIVGGELSHLSRVVVIDETRESRQVARFRDIPCPFAQIVRRERIGIDRDPFIDQLRVAADCPERRLILVQRCENQGNARELGVVITHGAIDYTKKALRLLVDLVAGVRVLLRIVVRFAEGFDEGVGETWIQLDLIQNVPITLKQPRMIARHGQHVEAVCRLRDPE